MNRRITLLLGTAAALAATAPAGAAVVQVQGRDTLAFEPAKVTVAVGDSVHWTFEPVTPHNVLAASPNWSGFESPLQVAAPPADFTFTTPGIYTYYCRAHGTGMSGEITVGNPPPPPPPPLSEQPFPNDGSVAPADFEIGGLDTSRPALRKVALDRSGRRVTLRFRVSERSAVTVRLDRAGKRVRTKRVAAAGRASVTLRGLRPGRYRIELRARDRAGNASAARVAHVTVG